MAFPAVNHVLVGELKTVSVERPVRLRCLESSRLTFLLFATAMEENVVPGELY